MSADTKSVERLQSHIEWLEGDHENCNPFLADDIRALRAERDAATARVAELEARLAEERRRALTVKPLEWEMVVDGKRGSYERRKWDAVSHFGVVYEIWDYDFVNWRGGPPASDARSQDTRYTLNMDGRNRLHQSYHPTLEAAKAAAQADYERRILSALSDAPPCESARRSDAPAREVTVREAAQVLQDPENFREVTDACAGKVRAYKFINVLRALSQGGEG
jgi:hypothetical protein